MVFPEVLLVIGALFTLGTTQTYVPCQEISPELKFPCSCALGPAEQALEGSASLLINCDRTVFAHDVSFIPYGAPAVYFSQKFAGHQSLPSQIFTSSLPLRSIDLSYNSLRKLTERMLSNTKSTLNELRLAHNLLGDTLNPIFSTSEFRGLKQINLLDLRSNGIKSMEEGIFEGCDNLKELYLDGNDFQVIPSGSLNGPKSLKMLSLSHNSIESIRIEAFNSQLSLETINLDGNYIANIESGAFGGLDSIQTLKLSHNRLSKFNSDIFLGAESLKSLDLSENFMVEFPAVALKVFESLRHLNLSSNLIQTLDNTHLSSLTSLYDLDLSRNSLSNIVPGTFLGLKQLQRLDISVNSLRTIEDDAFEGLDRLQHLNLKDNNILLIPASAVGRLPHLESLQLDYNRITALSGDILSSIADKVTNLVISTNLVRELPGGTFREFKNLQNLDLKRNFIATLTASAFAGLERSLSHLDLSENRIVNLPDPAISLSALRSLNLSSNHLTELSRGVFMLMPNLRELILSNNYHLTKLPIGLLKELKKLEVIDLSYCGLSNLNAETFSHSTSLKEIRLNHNNFSELVENSFVNMQNLTSIDLSYNNISTIKPSTFVFVMNIKSLSLKGNQMTSFKGEYFNTGTSLEVLDISDNQLSYLFPSSFRIHPRLRKIIASNNKFNFFPAELIANLQFLEYIDVSFNELKSIDELDFARLPRLRSLILNNNQLESLSEMAFHNSTQLQVLDLSKNKLDRIGERTFEGLIRLELLNLADNSIADFPENIFERIRLQMLDNIILSGNKFVVPPLKALQRQYFFLDSVDLSHNQIETIPEEDGIMVNIKNLDFSYNPLSTEAIVNILSEPKTVRSLNLAGTGMTGLVRLETPFLRHLNLSHNNISRLPSGAFERTTLLENLDLSVNNLMSTNSFSETWKYLRNLQALNISNNPIEAIGVNDYEGLNKLRHLSIHSLKECAKIEKSAFRNLPNLVQLEAYEYPKLGYLDLNGMLQNMPLLERVNIETKDAAIGKDQLQSVLHPRLSELTVTGFRLRSVSSGTLSGIKGSDVSIGFVNTSLTSIAPAFFFPLPRSSKVTLDVTGNQISSLGVPLLTALEDRRGDLKLTGLETNPIVCDCNARGLRRWLPSHMMSVRCSAPDYLAGRLLVDIGDTELTCDPKKIPTTTQTAPSAETTKFQRKTTEPDIIWSMPATEKTQPKIKTASTGHQSAFNNDDTLIIGIVGGVVAFIAVLIIVICIIRLRMSSSQYRNGAVPPPGSIVPPGMIGSGSSCACSVKGGPAGSVATPMYTLPPNYATLPYKMAAVHQGGMRVPSAAYSTMGRYQPSNIQPYFIATYPNDEKVYR